MIKKLKTISLSLIPIVAFVLIMHIFVQKIETEVFWRFFVGVGLLIIGQVVFLTGIENSIEPMGEFVGSSVSSNNRFFIYIIFGIVFGIVSTVAEPDMQVFASRVILAGFSVNKFVFLIVAGVGVGLFIALALVRVAMKFSLRLTLLISYLIAIVLAIFAGENALAMGLDVGANTTGVITSPFLLALGLVVARITATGKNRESDGFGFIALSSIGPVIAILILSLFIKQETVVGGGVENHSALWLETLKDVSFSIIPLVLVFFIFEALFIKISKWEKKKLLVGSAVTFVGFYLFLFGINFGLTDMGEAIGGVLKGFDSLTFVVIICSILGFLIVFSEPSIKILANNIEQATNRNIRSGVVVVAIAISVMISMMLAVLKITLNISMWWFVGIIFGLAFLLMLISPRLFVAIGFDSSGVATGTMVVAFIFPIMGGLAGNTMESFGVIGLLSMTPIVVMELLGVVYRIYTTAENRRATKMLLRLSRTEDKFSNIEKLKDRHNELVGSR